MPSLTDIAAALREHSPGALPESLTIEDNCGAPGLYAHGVYLHDDIAAAVLIACMVQDGYVRRGNACWFINDRKTGEECHWEPDSDHGGSLGACYQAWRWSKGLPAA